MPSSSSHSITVVTGLLFLLLAVLRMGWISLLLSKAVITGFLFGAAIEVVVGELAEDHRDVRRRLQLVAKLGDWIGALGDIDGATLLVGVVSLLVVVGVRFSPLKVPGALVLVVGGLLASVLLDFEGRGIALVGDVPRGFAAPRSRARLRRRQHRDDRTGGGRSALDRLLPDSGGLTGVRIQAWLPRRHRPGVGGTEHVEPRIGRVAGHPGVHEPVGEFAQRRVRRKDTPRVADDRGVDRAHPARARTAVLRSPPTGTRRRSSSTRSSSG